MFSKKLSWCVMGTLLLSTVAVAGSKPLSVAAATVDNSPALRYSQGRASTTVTRAGKPSAPVFSFHLAVADAGFSSFRHGVLLISTDKVEWKSDDRPQDNFTMPRSSLVIEPYMRGWGHRFEVSGQRKYITVNAEGVEGDCVREMLEAVFTLVNDLLRDFHAGDARFWQLRGEPMPTVAPTMDANFRAQAAAWRALAVKPEMPEETRRQRVLAESYLREKDFKGAIQHYEAGLASFSTWPEGWFNLALLYGETGAYAQAADRMKHYLELAPDSPDSASARDKIIIWEDKAAQH